MTESTNRLKSEAGANLAVGVLIDVVPVGIAFEEDHAPGVLGIRLSFGEDLWLSLVRFSQ
jgi:hypothetical protein